MSSHPNVSPPFAPAFAPRLRRHRTKPAIRTAFLAVLTIATTLALAGPAAHRAAAAEAEASCGRLAWVGRTQLTNRIFISDDQGASRRLATFAPGLSQIADLSIGGAGTLLGFSAMDALTARTEVFVLDTSTSVEPVRITDGIEEVEAISGPVIAPDGQAIAWIATTPTDEGEVFLSDIAGASVQRLSRHLGQEAADLRWSPDGSLLAFTVETPSGRRAFVHRRGDDQPEPLPDGDVGPSGIALASFSPDSRHLAWTSGGDLATVARVTDLQTGDVRRVDELVGLTASQAEAWTPDGTRLAWSGRDDDSGALVSVDVDGSNPEFIQLPAIDVFPQEAAWSPTGREFAWSEYIRAQEHSRVVTRRAGATANPLSGEGVVVQPLGLRPWAPDGSALAWRWGPSGDTEVEVTDTASTLRRQASRRILEPSSTGDVRFVDPVDNQTPVWSPAFSSVELTADELSDGWEFHADNTGPCTVHPFLRTGSDCPITYGGAGEVRETASGYVLPMGPVDPGERTTRVVQTPGCVGEVMVVAANITAVTMDFGVSGPPVDPDVPKPGPGDPGPVDPCGSDESPFTDIAGSFAETDTACIHALGITTGTSPTTYSPTHPVTREQMAAFLARTIRTLGATCPTPTTTPFTDIAGSFAETDTACIHALGITTGTSPTTYSPTHPVTREQMAAFLARTIRTLGPLARAV